MNVKLLWEAIRARRYTMLIIALLLCCNIGLSIFLFGYQKPALETLQSEWFEKRKRGGTSTADTAAVYEQAKRDLDVWLSRIPPKKDFARFLGELFEMAANNQLAVKGVTYKPAVIKDQGLLVYTLDVSVSGSYAAIKSFIADIMRSRQIIVIDNLQLTNSSQTKEAPDLKLNLTTYLRMEGQ